MLFCVFYASASRAADRPPCFDAFAAGQELAQKNEFRAAREKFRVCLGDATCPAPPLLKDCLDDLHGVEARIGSIVVEAIDAHGGSLIDVTLAIDGVEVTTKLDGKAIELDPGEHLLVLHAEKKKPFERKVLVGEGEKLKRVVATMEDVEGAQPPIAPTTEVAAEHRASTAVWIFGAVGIAGVVGFGTLGLLGQHTYDDCRDHGCDSSTTSRLKLERTLAWTSLGVGVASLATAGILYFSSGSSNDGAHVGVAPTPGGASAWLHVWF